MTPKDIRSIKAKLVELNDAPETSDALRTYLDEALWRDPVDVLNEVESLARLLKEELAQRDINSERV